MKIKKSKLNDVVTIDLYKVDMKIVFNILEIFASDSVYVNVIDDRTNLHSLFNSECKKQILVAMENLKKSWDSIVNEQPEIFQIMDLYEGRGLENFDSSDYFCQQEYVQKKKIRFFINIYFDEKTVTITYNSSFYDNNQILQCLRQF